MGVDGASLARSSRAAPGRRALVALAVTIIGLAGADLSSKAASVGPASTWGVSVRVVGAPLWPGVGSQTVQYTITNNTDVHQHLTSAGASMRSDSSRGSNGFGT